MPALPSPFWSPISILVEAMGDPFETSIVFGLLGWIAVLSATAGLYLCISRRGYRALWALAAVVPLYLAIVIYFWTGANRFVQREYLGELRAMSVVAASLALAAIVIGFVRSGGNRLVSALMLPINAVFALGLVLVTALAARS